VIVLRSTHERLIKVERDVVAFLRHQVESMKALCDARVESYHRDLNAACTRTELAERRYDDLLEKYHELKASGAAAREGLPPAERSRLAADLAIEDVVEQRGGGDRLRRVLRRFVNVERQRDDADEDKIAERVRRWSDPDEEAA
jgi:hypothetical protein